MPPDISELSLRRPDAADFRADCDDHVCADFREKDSN